MSEITNPDAVPVFKQGDRVRIKDFGGNVGRIVELRGPLGPGGALVYRVLVQRRPTVTHVELLGDQLEIVSSPTVAAQSKLGEDASKHTGAS